MENKEKAITRKDITYLISEKYKIDIVISKQIVDSFFDIIVKTLITGESVKLSCFGSFNVVHKNARPGRNPKTGEYKEISSRNVIKFKPSKKLRSKQLL